MLIYLSFICVCVRECLSFGLLDFGGSVVYCRVVFFSAANRILRCCGDLAFVLQLGNNVIGL